jgi:RNA polymerase sigma-B factor
MVNPRTSDFDAGIGTPFGGYARIKIHGEIKRFLRDHCWDVRPPRALQDRHVEIRRATERPSAVLGRSPTVGEVAEDLCVSSGWVLEGLDAARLYRIERLDAPVRNGDEAALLGAQVGAEDAELTQVERRALLRDLLDPLDAAEVSAVRMRYLEDLGQREIAENLGLSQPRVSRLLAAAIEKIQQEAATSGRQRELDGSFGGGRLDGKRVAGRPRRGRLR